MLPVADRWRSALAAVVLAASGAGVRAHQDEPAMPPAVQALVRQAESALAAGDPALAQDLFEQAAARWHAAPIEAGWVRAQMQSGDYAHALAFAAHVAGAHPEESTGTVLYAWLLALGAQRAPAQQLVAQALSRWPGDVVLKQLAQRLAEDRPLAAPQEDGTWPLTELAPYATGDVVAPDAWVAGTAALWSPDVALVPAVAWPEGATLWLRDGMGRTRAAADRRWSNELRLWVVRLSSPLEGSLPAQSVRDAFPGSPAFAAGYARGGAAAPQWPQLALGFVGMPVDRSRARLGFASPDRDGGPVFDAAGRWVGIVTGLEGSAQPLYVPVSRVQAVLAGDVTTTAAVGEHLRPNAPLGAAEAAYAASLRAALACLVSGTPRITAATPTTPLTTPAPAR